MASTVQPHAWIGLKLPSENVRFLQVVPNTTISLGKYGSFPSNLIIHRPFHLTYELLDKQEGEAFCRLRIVPATELYADVLAEEDAAAATGRGGLSTPDDEGGEGEVGTLGGASSAVEYSLVDLESQAVIARSNRAAMDASARQALSTAEIEALKREGTDAGKDLIAKLLLSHAALDQKTSFSLAKYKLLKTRKYIRRFTVLPLDVYALGRWLRDDREVGPKILDLRDELTALLGCWGNVHYGGEDRYVEGAVEAEGKAEGEQQQQPALPDDVSWQLGGGRWLMVDDTGGLLVAAMAERMGILYREEAGEDGAENGGTASKPTETEADTQMADASAAIGEPKPRKRARDDFVVPFSLNNTITLLHANGQANLAYLRYFGYDHADPSPAPHPLNEHLLSLTWLQLLEPESDTVYAEAPRAEAAEVVAAWKPARRGNYHRKRRRWARMRHIVEATRAGGFAGLVVATTLDLVSTLRHALPLVASGAPVAVYSPSLEPLVALADCFSVARRAAWSGDGAPAAVATQTAAELERWPGSAAFPLNPMLLLGVAVQTSRARTWQVLPGRTHPLMTARGGGEGYVLTGWKVKPAEGRVTARGKFKKRREG